MCAAIHKTAKIQKFTYYGAEWESFRIGGFCEIVCPATPGLAITEMPSGNWVVTARLKHSTGAEVDHAWPFTTSDAALRWAAHFTTSNRRKATGKPGPCFTFKRLHKTKAFRRPARITGKVA